VRLITKGGHCTNRFPWIVETAHKLRSEQCILDGEAVVLGVDGNSDFRALDSRKHDHEVQFYAFDILGADDDDYRRLPLSLRKTNLARLLRNRAEGIHAAPFEHGEIGADLFQHACILRLKGMVSMPAGPRVPPGTLRPLDQEQEPAASGLPQGPG
jgi:bifunctional non-homologous end joining protein LigD